MARVEKLYRHVYVTGISGVSVATEFVGEYRPTKCSRACYRMHCLERDGKTDTPRYAMLRSIALRHLSGA